MIDGIFIGCTPHAKLALGDSLAEQARAVYMMEAGRAFGKVEQPTSDDSVIMELYELEGTDVCALVSAFPPLVILGSEAEIDVILEGRK